MGKIEIAVKEMAKLYKEITRSKYNPSDLFLLDSTGRIKDLYGNVLDARDYESLNGVLESIKKNPKRAQSFSIEFTDEKYKLIYIPDQTVSPENFTPDGYLRFEAALEVFEETFHALDDIPSNNLRNRSAREAFAVLARYIGIRYLKEKGYIVPTNMNDIIYYSIDHTFYEKQGNYLNGYLDVYSYTSIPEKEYLPRLWLVGLIKSLENMSFEDAIKEVKRIYQSAKHSKDPLGIVEQQGLKHSTVPSLEIITLMYHI